MIPDSVLCKKWGSQSLSDRLAVVRDIVRRLGFPENIIHFDWPDWLPKITPELKKFADPNEYLGTHRSCLLAGPVGTGKTALLCSMAKELFLVYADRLPEVSTMAICREYMKRTYFFHYREFTTMIREGIREDRQGIDLAELTDFWAEAPYLIIDDLLDGVVKDWDLTCLHGLIDRRYSKRLPTWISTNFPAKAGKEGGADLATWPGFERTYSRLADKDWCKYFQIVGPDRRRSK